MDVTFTTKVRMTMVVVVIAAGLTAVIGRVYYLQTVQGVELSQKSDDQVERTVKLKARRGSIKDRNGVELAVSVQAPSVAIRPRRIVDVADTTRRLSQILGLKPSVVSKRLSKSSNFVWMARQVSPAVAERVASAEIPGVEIHVENKRFYPQRSLAGQIVGFTNIDGKGLEGLERKFNESLRGEEYSIEGIRDARGRTLMTLESPNFDRLEGHSLVLTLDERIQRVAEESLMDQVTKHEALGGYAVAMDVKTGEILAMANTPRFDPNQYKTSSPAEYRLRNVTDAMEPGSVVKPMVLAAAIEEKGTKLHSEFWCENGRMQIGRRSIKDSHKNETLTAAEVVRESSNICAYKIAQTIGREKLYQYLQDFGFGWRQIRDLGGEQAGLLWPPKHWAEITFANIAFGQGLSATPVQVTNATAALANGGYLMRPHIVKRVVDRDGNTVRETAPQVMKRVVSEQTAKDATWSMALVTTVEGTAPNAALERYTVAGKTGTAQKPIKGGKGYDPDGWIASFVGFAPAEDPDVVVLVAIDEPQGSHYGGVVAAPAFKRIMEEALTSRNVMPVPENERLKLPHETIFEKAARLEAAKAETLAVEQVAESEPKPEPAPTPAFVGKTLRDAKLFAKENGVSIEHTGWGIVVDQEPVEPKPGETVKLALRPPTSAAPNPVP